jgi:hypothetical protein
MSCAVPGLYIVSSVDIRRYGVAVSVDSSDEFPPEDGGKNHSQMYPCFKQKEEDGNIHKQNNLPFPPLLSSSQSSWLLTQRSRVRFPALPDFLSSSGSGTGSTQPL